MFNGKIMVGQAFYHGRYQSRPPLNNASPPPDFVSSQLNVFYKLT